VVRKLQGTDTHIPAQINRQQPVYMIDAFGKATPFHLEFIQSAEVKSVPVVDILVTNRPCRR